MKPILYILIFSLLGLTSCGEMNSLSSFSKRKYFKKPPKQKAVEKVIQPETASYASTELTLETFVLEEIPAIADEQNLEASIELIVPREVSSTAIPSAFKNHSMDNLLDKLVKDVKYNQYKSKDGEFLSALIASGAPWWIILIVLFICLLVWGIAGTN